MTTRRYRPAGTFLRARRAAKKAGGTARVTSKGKIIVSVPTTVANELQVLTEQFERGEIPPETFKELKKRVEETGSLKKAQEELAEEVKPKLEYPKQVTPAFGVVREVESPSFLQMQWSKLKRGALSPFYPQSEFRAKELARGGFALTREEQIERLGPGFVRSFLVGAPAGATLGALGTVGKVGAVGLTAISAPSITKGLVQRETRAETLSSLLGFGLGGAAGARLAPQLKTAALKAKARTTPIRAIDTAQVAVEKPPAPGTETLFKDTKGFDVASVSKFIVGRGKKAKEMFAGAKGLALGKQISEKITLTGAKLRGVTEEGELLPVTRAYGFAKEVAPKVIRGGVISKTGKQAAEAFAFTSRTLKRAGDVVFEEGIGELRKVPGKLGIPTTFRSVTRFLPEVKEKEVGGGITTILKTKKTITPESSLKLKTATEQVGKEVVREKLISSIPEPTSPGGLITTTVPQFQKPSVYAGKGMYERTGEVGISVGPAPTKQLGKERYGPTISEVTALKPIISEKQAKGLALKPASTTSLLPAQKVAPQEAQKPKPIEAQLPMIGEQQVQKQQLGFVGGVGGFRRTVTTPKFGRGAFALPLLQLGGGLRRTRKRALLLKKGRTRISPSLIGLTYTKKFKPITRAKARKQIVTGLGVRPQIKGSSRRFSSF